MARMTNLCVYDVVWCDRNAILTEQTTRASSGHSGHGLYGHHGQLQGVYEEPLLLYEDSQEMVGAVGAASSPGRHHRESRGGGYPGSGGGYRQQRQRSMSYDPALPPPTVQNLTLIRDTLQHGPGVPAAGALAFIKEAQASYLMQEVWSKDKPSLVNVITLVDPCMYRGQTLSVMCVYDNEVYVYDNEVYVYDCDLQLVQCHTNCCDVW